jgi:hypothetical protein
VVLAGLGGACAAGAEPVLASVDAAVDKRRRVECGCVGGVVGGACEDADG